MNLPTLPPLPAEEIRPGRLSTPSDPAHSPFIHSPLSAALPISTFSLPDGTPLTLTMSRKIRYVQITGSLEVATPDDAFVLLYLSSPHYDPRERWVTPAPLEPGSSEAALRTADLDYFTALRLRIEDWADTLPHTLIGALYLLAIDLWFDAHVTQAIAVPGSDKTPEKKSPESPPTGLSSTAASSPGETSPGTEPSSTTLPSASSTPPSTPGEPSRECSSSPPDSGTPASAPPTP